MSLETKLQIEKGLWRRIRDKINDKLVTYGGALLLTLTPSAINNCGTESADSYKEEPTVECYTDSDCLGNQICKNNWCVNPPPEPEEETPELSGGRIVYIDGKFANSDTLFSFDLDTKKKSVFLPEIEYDAWEHINKSTDNSTIILESKSQGKSCNIPQTYFYLLNSDGTNLRGVSYIPACPLWNESGDQYPDMFGPAPKLLSNNSSIVAILGTEDGHLFRIDSEGTLKQLTSSEEGINDVSEMVVSPSDKIYFCCRQDTQDKKVLYEMDSNGNNKRLVAELNIYPNEMHWVSGRNKILVRDSRNAYLLDPNTGSYEKLDIYVENYNNLIVFPDGNKIIYENGYYHYLFDLNQNEYIRINKQNFPGCEESDCLQIDEGIWLP